MEKKIIARKIQAHQDDSALMADLERYQQQALELGASAAQIIAANNVVIDDRVRLKCAVPRCHLYGESANCPPYTPAPEEMRRILSNYAYGVIFKHNVEPVADFAHGEQWHRGHMKQQRKSSDVASGIEALAYNDGYYFAVGFGAGGCKTTFCGGQICGFLDSGRCRFPLRSRPSMEAVGIDVFKTITQIGWDVYPIAHKDVELDSIKCAVSIGIVFIN